MGSQEIANLLNHYMGTAFRGAGLAWDGDNTAEMDMLVDRIGQLAADEADRVAAELRREIGELRRDVHGEIADLWAAINQTRNDIGP